MGGSDFVLSVVAIRLALLVATGLLLQSLPARSHQGPGDAIALSSTTGVSSEMIASVEREDTTLKELKLHD